MTKVIYTKLDMKYDRRLRGEGYDTFAQQLLTLPAYKYEIPLQITMSMGQVSMSDHFLFKSE